MRTNLFRGKNSKTGEWVYGDFVYMVGYVPFIHKSYDGEEVSKKVDPETVGQWTGLTDRNGDYVYEGDILKDPDNGKFGMVVWNGTSYHLQFGVNLYCTDDINYYCLVGNKWDNPELLKSKETSLKDEDIYLHSQIEKFSDAVAKCDNLLKAAEGNGIRLETRNYEKGYAIEVKIRRIATADEIRDMWRRNGGVKL